MVGLALYLFWGNHSFAQSRLSTAGFEYKQKAIQGILLSTKIGYHSGYKQKDFFGFAPGLIFDFSADNTITKTISLGVNGELWKSSDDKFPDIYGNPTLRDYSAWGISFVVKFRKSIQRWNLSIGLGLGTYRISVTSEGYADTDGYANGSFLADLGFILTDHFMISTEFSLKGLFNFDVTKSFYSLKLGPTLILL